MRLEDAIRQHGFPRWYERRLIEGHAFLVTALLALLAILVVFEMVDFSKSITGFLWLIGIAGTGGVVCIHAFGQFSRLTFGAHMLAEQARCPKCATYAKFQVIHAVDAPDKLEGRELTVRCRVCEAEWTIG
jgi:hypothetical protein